MQWYSLVCALFLSVSVCATPIQIKVDQTVSKGQYKVGVGSGLSLAIPGKSGNHSGVFLGRLVQPSGDFSQYMFLDRDEKRAYLAGQGNAVFENAKSFQPVLNQYNQIDGTCTGYAIDHFIQQMHWSEGGNANLKSTLSTEKGRTQLLVEAINNYYLATQHRYSVESILNGFGKKFGFRCRKNSFSDFASARLYLDRQMRSGLPVLISFFIGPTMVNSDIRIKSVETGKLVDPRLWVPRKIGERESGGHSVVAVSAFELNGHAKLLMLDSDWAEPRIWDVESYLGGKTDVKAIEFFDCRNGS